MSNSFDQVYKKWIEKQIAEETNPRRRELLKKGLSYSTIAFLKRIWFPVFGNFNHLYAEYEVRDLDNKIRYLDLAYLPGGGIKGCIEIQDFRSHARDIEAGRFKDLCMKHASLALDDWYFLPIAFLSIRDEPSVCRKLVLSFVGKFLSLNDSMILRDLSWSEAETLRFARRLMRPFEVGELSSHLLLSHNRARVVLRSLLSKNLIIVASGKQRYRTFRINDHMFSEVEK